jgi:hypothetical protein
MRDLEELRAYVLEDEGIPQISEQGGWFRVFGLNVIVGIGEGWDHVSVSRRDRTPTWNEMNMIKRMFFKDDELCYQLHMPVKDYINVHPYCLHMWRPHDQVIPLPPKEMV